MPPLSAVIDPYHITNKEHNHFHANPWASSILKSSLQDGKGDYYPVLTWSRVPKLDTGEDGLFAQTLDSPQTIPFWLTLRRKNPGSHTSQLPKSPPTITVTTKSRSPGSGTHTGSNSAQKSYTAPALPSRPPDTITLITLGTPGVSGHPSIAHGGLIASLFDEVMSLAANIHLIEVFQPKDSSHDRIKFFTAQLDIRYKRPVSVPNLVVFKAWAVAHDGRKFWTFAQAIQEETANSNESDGMILEHPRRELVMAECSSLWIIVDGPESKI